MAAEINGRGTAYNNSTTNNVSLDNIISDYVLYMFQVVVYATFIGLVSMFGIVANIINILIFVKQGLMSDSSNVSLCSLAVTDLCCLVCLLGMSALWSILLLKPPGLTWDPHSFMFLAGYFYITFSCITCTTSAYISFERCMCVVFPFKVKNLFTAKRSLIIMICIYSFFMMCMVPIFMTLRLRRDQDPMTNTSLLMLHTLRYHDVIELIMIRYINSIGGRTATVLVVTVCTQLIAHRVKSSWNWRKSATMSTHAQTPRPTSSNEQTVYADDDKVKYEDVGKQSKSNTEKSQTANKLPSKETTLIKMITAISTIFIICSTPDITLSYLMLGVPEIRNLGQYHNTFYVLYSLKFFMESINSSVNIFVYYNMSTRYRNIFKEMMGMERWETNKPIS